MPQSLTSRTPNGLTNAAPHQTMGDAGVLDPSWAHSDFDDFDRYAAGDWTVSVTGTGGVTQTPVDGGAILLSTSAGIADLVYMQRAVASNKLTAGKDVFFKFSGILSDVTASVFHCGLIATSATPLAANDGVYITKATGQAGLSLVSKIGGVATTVAFPSSEVLINATKFELGIHIDSQGNVFAYFNPTTGANQPAIFSAGGASRGPVAKIASPSLTQVLLNPSFGLLNSAAAIKTLTVDYFAAVTHR